MPQLQSYNPFGSGSVAATTTVQRPDRVWLKTLAVASGVTSVTIEDSALNFVSYPNGFYIRGVNLTLATFSSAATLTAYLRKNFADVTGTYTYAYNSISGVTVSGASTTTASAVPLNSDSLGSISQYHPLMEFFVSPYGIVYSIAKTSGGSPTTGTIAYPSGAVSVPGLTADAMGLRLILSSGTLGGGTFDVYGVQS